MHFMVCWKDDMTKAMDGEYYRVSALNKEWAITKFLKNQYEGIYRTQTLCEWTPEDMDRLIMRGFITDVYDDSVALTKLIGRNKKVMEFRDKLLADIVHIQMSGEMDPKLSVGKLRFKIIDKLCDRYPSPVLTDELHMGSHMRYYLEFAKEEVFAVELKNLPCYNNHC